MQKVVWDGKAPAASSREGLYSFQACRHRPGCCATAGAPSSEDAFAFYGHMFPVRGKHDYGGEGGALRRRPHRTPAPGPGRASPAAGRRCWRPRRQGRLQGLPLAAGYYLVIHGSGSDMDYVYAHLREPAVVASGDRVYTGQPIGEVGDSGNARGCHLHFELWSAPGWYKGGRPFDPLPELRRWDSVS